MRPITRITLRLALLLPLAALLILPVNRLAAGEESYTLANGLKVILAERPGSGVTAGRLFFKIGSADENGVAENGMAHLLEHMAFKSTAKRGLAEISRTIADNGGSTNAYTTKTRTCYIIDLPTEAANLIPDLLADMTFGQRFDPGELADEEEVVSEEIRMSLDNPSAMLWREIDRGMYGAHPYGRPVLGTEQTVKGITPEAIRNFHRRHYRPDNAVLVIAGEFDAEVMRQEIDRHFSQLRLARVQPEAGSESRSDPLPLRHEPRVLTIANPQATLARMFISFRGLPRTETEAMRLNLLGTFLSGGLASRLVERVKKEKELVTGIYAFVNDGIEPAPFFVALETSPDKLAPALEATLAELKNIFAEAPSTGEMARAVILEKKATLRRQEEAGRLANDLGEFELIYGDWRHLAIYPAILGATQPDDLTRLAASLFAGGNLTVVTMLPEEARDALPGYQTEMENIAAKFSPPPAAPTAEAKPGFEELPPVDGVRLLVMRDPSSPLVSVIAGVRGGTLAENAGNNGLFRLMADSWSKATRSRDAAALARAAEDLGADIASSSGNINLNLTGSFLGENWRQGLGLFTEVLTQPAFAPADVEESRRDLLADIDRVEENLPDRTMQLLDESLYAGHPFSLESLGRREQVAAFSPADLAELHRRVIQNGALIIVAAGNVDPLEFRALLAKGLKGWRPAEAAAPLPIPAAPAPREKREFAFKAMDGKQTHLALGLAGPDRESPDRPALGVLLSHLGGMGGVLFTELRDKQSLAYSIGAGSDAFKNAGIIRFYLACEPGKAPSALSGMVAILENILANGVTPEETEAAKRHLVGNIRIQYQTPAKKASQAFLHSIEGLDVGYSDQYIEAIGKVTAEDVNRMAKKYLTLDRSVVAALGPESSLRSLEK